MTYRKTALAVTVTVFAGAGLPAAAQSSVTLFGVMDAAIRHVDNGNGASQTSLTSGGNTTSRIGFRGVEDLGGGMRAGFHLESGLAIDNGTAGSNGMFFDRRSTVSLIARQFGELRLGRDRVMSHILFSDADPFSFTGLAKASNMQAAGSTNLGPVRSAMGATPSGLNALTRSNNLIQYFSPAFGGLEAGVWYQLRENGSALTGSHKSAGVRVKYSAGPFKAGAAIQKVSNDITAGASLKDAVLAAGYDFGVAEMTLAVRRFSYTTSTHTNYLLGAAVPLGNGKLNASFVKSNLAGRVGAVNIDGNDATQIGVGYEHNLSKRTALYTTVARIRNRGVQTFTLGPAVAPGGSSKGIDIGVLHKF